MIVAFTGPSKLTKFQEVKVAEKLFLVRHATVWRSGCAFGADTIVADEANLDLCRLELYVPSSPHNEELVDQFHDYANVRIINCPYKVNPYRIRNELMVDGADLLVAFFKSDRFYRSGEWMTVNIAKRFGVPVESHII